MRLASVDCSLRAEALTTGPAVRLHPSDASDSLRGSGPTATARKGRYAPRFFSAGRHDPLLIPGGGLLVFFLSPPPGPYSQGGQNAGSGGERAPLGPAAEPASYSWARRDSCFR